VNIRACSPLFALHVLFCGGSGSAKKGRGVSNFDPALSGCNQKNNLFASKIKKVANA
jgi:hypothetical protein